MTAVSDSLIKNYWCMVEGVWSNGRTMSLNIKNAEAHALAVRVAQATGESLTEAVTVALRERLARLEFPGALEQELLALGRDCAARLKEPWRSADYADLLYDDKGLPR